MAVQFTIAFAAFFVENENFLAAALVIEYFANHLRTLNYWGTYFYLTVVVNEKHFLECYLSTLLSCHAVNKEFLASLNAILKALHFYNCVHLLKCFLISYIGQARCRVVDVGIPKMISSVPSAALLWSPKAEKACKGTTFF
jgi:hypothetical protein